MEKLLDKVNCPEDIRGFSTEQLMELCSEIRDYMLECCAVNPGHLGSSLGAVELITGIHYVYDTPHDKVVFDVSHQTYAHKILTGRKEAFKENRKKGGISGFTRRDESVYDVFGAGHASTSISAALGLADAAKLSGRDEKVIALIGDGALTGGLAQEGINNAGANNDDILIILNDNNISIDKSTGSLHNYLLKVTTDPKYNSLKEIVWKTMGESKHRSKVQKVVKTAKSMFVKYERGALFESLGFRYFGPINGNDITQVVDTLKKLKEIKGPKILHAITLKGKGFAPAEEDQTTWHAPGMFDPETGKRLKNPSIGKNRFQDVFGETLLELARKDSRIVGVTPAMASGCGMNLLSHEMPERFFDVGIAEEHAVTFSAGLAAGGMKPFCNIYSSFSQRAYDQIIHDVALQHLGVVLCFDRAGLVGEDGATHHGCYDIAAYRSIPGTVIAVPSDEAELKNMMYTASLRETGPFIIRYPRGYAEGIPWREIPFEKIKEGESRKLVDGDEIAILAAGPCAWTAAKIAKDFKDADVCVYDVRYIKPFDLGMLARVCEKCTHIITVEDGARKGGLYSEVCEDIFSLKPERTPEIIGIGIPDSFLGQATQKELHEECGLDEKGILDTLEAICKKISKK